MRQVFSEWATKTLKEILESLIHEQQRVLTDAFLDI